MGENHTISSQDIFSHTQDFLFWNFRRISWSITVIAITPLTFLFFPPLASRFNQVFEKKVSESWERARWATFEFGAPLWLTPVWMVWRISKGDSAQCNGPGQSEFCTALYCPDMLPRGSCNFWKMTHNWWGRVQPVTGCHITNLVQLARFTWKTSHEKRWTSLRKWPESLR